MISNFLDSNVIYAIEHISNDREYAFIVRFNSLIPLENFSSNPAQILFDASNLQDGDEIIHTHYSDSMTGTLSNEDITTSLSLRIGTYLYHVDFGVWDYFNPNFPHPYPLKLVRPERLEHLNYLGLKYSPYRCNCYTLVRDYAKGVLNINYPYININSNNGNIEEFFKEPDKFGFKRRLDKYKVGDLVILYVSREIPYHIGIVTTLSPFPMMLHVLSEKRNSEPIRLDTFRRNIQSVWYI